jgi:hypothetical protein
MPFTRQWYLDAAGTVFCISMAALAAGLTVGLVSIDPFEVAPAFFASSY